MANNSDKYVFGSSEEISQFLIKLVVDSAKCAIADGGKFTLG